MQWLTHKINLRGADIIKGAEMRGKKVLLHKCLLSVQNLTQILAFL